MPADLQSAKSRKFGATVPSLRKVLTVFHMERLDDLLDNVIATPQFLDPFTAFREAYLLHPSNTSLRFQCGSPDMCELFGSIQREVNGRVAKLRPLSENAEARSHTVRLFSLLVRRMTEKGGLYAAIDVGDAVWLYKACEKLEVLIEYIKKEYELGRGVVMQCIEGKKPSPWLMNDSGWKVTDEEEVGDVEEWNKEDGKVEEGEEDAARRRMSEFEDSSDAFDPGSSSSDNEDDEDEDESLGDDDEIDLTVARPKSRSKSRSKPPPTPKSAPQKDSSIASSPFTSPNPANHNPSNIDTPYSPFSNSRKIGAANKQARGLQHPAPVMPISCMLPPISHVRATPPPMLPPIPPPPASTVPNAHLDPRRLRTQPPIQHIASSSVDLPPIQRSETSPILPSIHHFDPPIMPDQKRFQPSDFASTIDNTNTFPPMKYTKLTNEPDILPAYFHPNVSAASMHQPLFSIPMKDVKRESYRRAVEVQMRPVP